MSVEAIERDQDKPAGELKSFVSQVVRSHWEQHHKALLLSGLGLRIRRERPDLAPLLLNVGLRSFLKTAHVVQVVVHPRQDQKIGAVPLDVRLPEDVTPLFEEGTTSWRRPTLLRQFWEAFHTMPTERRFVIVSEGVAPQVVEHSQPPSLISGSAYEILESDIVRPVPLLLREKVAETWRKVDGWLARYKLNASLFQAPELGGLGESPTQWRSEESASDTTLGSAIARLNAIDQSRILIPLDLVSKMLSGK